MTTILVADDERNILQLVRLYLAEDGFEVTTVTDGRQALELARQTRPDLLVLDLMMPGMNGWDVCRQLRRESDVPIIVLTARADDGDKIVGLELGADDYVTKPFNPRELVARVKAVLRRYQVGREPVRPIQVGNLRVDPARHEVTVNGRPVALRPKEFDLLVTLARSPGIVFDRDRLLKLAWGYDIPGDTRTVDVHVTWLREKLRESTARIQTVWGVGYKLVEAAAEEAGLVSPGGVETAPEPTGPVAG